MLLIVSKAAALGSPLTPLNIWITFSSFVHSSSITSSRTVALNSSPEVAVNGELGQEYEDTIISPRSVNFAKAEHNDLTNANSGTTVRSQMEPWAPYPSLIGCPLHWVHRYSTPSPAASFLASLTLSFTPIQNCLG